MNELYCLYVAPLDRLLQFFRIRCHWMLYTDLNVAIKETRSEQNVVTKKLQSETEFLSLCLSIIISLTMETRTKAFSLTSATVTSIT